MQNHQTPKTPTPAHVRNTRLAVADPGQADGANRGGAAEGDKSILGGLDLEMGAGLPERVADGLVDRAITAAANPGAVFSPVWSRPAATPQPFVWPREIV